MTGWIITGAILLFLLFLLGLRVTVVIDYCGDIFVRVSTLGITVFRIPASKKKKPGKKGNQEKAKKSKKSKKSQDEADNLEQTEKPKKEKPTLSELIDLIKLVLDSIGKPLKKLFMRIVISHLNLAIVCGGEDAAKAAINYGAANYLLSVLLNLCDEWFTLKEPDEIRVDVDFYKEKVEVKCYVEIRLTVGSALALVFTIIGRAIGYYLSHDDAKSAVKKLAAIKK